MTEPAKKDDKPADKAAEHKADHGHDAKPTRNIGEMILIAFVVLAALKQCSAANDIGNANMSIGRFLSQNILLLIILAVGLYVHKNKK